MGPDRPQAGTLKVAATFGRIGGQLVISESRPTHSRRTVPLFPPSSRCCASRRPARRPGDCAPPTSGRNTGLAFTTELGGPVDPRNLLRVIEVAPKAVGVTDVGVHTLRHSVAVAWLESGVHIKAVADLLGHSSIAITGDVYGHTSDDTARAAVNGLAGRLGL